MARKKAEVAVALSAQVDEHRTARDAATACPPRHGSSHRHRRHDPSTPAVPRARGNQVHGETQKHRAPIFCSASILTTSITDSHEPALTETRERRGKEFWAHVATGLEPTGKEHIRQGWQRLTELFGSTRAAWIARQLDPSQAATVTRRDDSWTRAPHQGWFLIAGSPSAIRGDGAISPPGAGDSRTVAVGP